MWNSQFFPAKGERHSPFDYIINVSPASEKAQIMHRLKTIQELPLNDWPHTWIHKIDDKIYQLTAGKHRLMYCIDKETIIVLHACRKRGQKTHQKDINKANKHYRDYISQRA